MPIIRLGRQRESIMTGSELYKKKVTNYLEARGFYVEKDSSTEGIFADLLLKKKNDDKEYWLETKSTIVDINDRARAHE